MAKVRLIFDREESYCLLVAQEYLRQMMVSDEGGIPLILSITPQISNLPGPLARFEFMFVGDYYILDVRLDASARWPKKGSAHLAVSGRMEAETGVVRHEFELRGSPLRPQVVFTKMRGGGR